MSNLITNRTNKETYYNASDLNRVENATAEVAELLTAEGYVVTINSKTDWHFTSEFNANEWLTATQMKRYLGNVQKCQRQFCAVPNIELPVSMNKLTYQGANNIEKFLEQVPILIENMKGCYRECNGFFCGEE